MANVFARLGGFVVPPHVPATGTVDGVVGFEQPTAITATTMSAAPR
jgi:hypothetical protein